MQHVYQLTKIKFNRSSVVVYKSNSQREKQINIGKLERRDPMIEQKQDEREKRALKNSVPLLKKSDSGYLKKRFRLSLLKGIDKVRTDKLFGSKKEVELETINMLKEEKKRFN